MSAPCEGFLAEAKLSRLTLAGGLARTAAFRAGPVRRPHLGDDLTEYRKHIEANHGEYRIRA
jgi:hypothetical protein